MCRCCQSCLESWYWTCCEERYCYDESIAKYCDDDWENEKCYSNNVGSIDNLGPITRQPNNNNHIPLDLDSNRQVLVELPILAPDIYRVFSKSMIFKEDLEVKKYIENEESKTDFLKPNYNEHAVKVVKFQNESNEEIENDALSESEDVKMSDFEIMFQDELRRDHHEMFKIEEEEEEESESSKSPTTPYGGLTFGSKNLEPVVDSPDNKHDKTIDTPNNKPIIRVDSSNSINRVNSAKCLPRTKSALLLSRTDSARSIANNTRPDFTVRRVDSMKNLESLRTVLARVPPRSASFLSIPDLLNEKEDKSKNGDIFTISGGVDFLENGEHSQISRMPDTPVIKGGKFPKFFAETPVIGEYKADTSLQSIVAQTPDVIFTESDFSMPRYYGKAKTIAKISAENSNQASKSLPDLNEANTDKISKRLSKLGSKLKPLII